MKNTEKNTPMPQSLKNAVSNSCGSINVNGLSKTNTVLDLSFLDKNQADFIKEKTGKSLKDGSYPFLIFYGFEYDKCTKYYCINDEFIILTYDEFVKIHFEN